MSVTIETLQKYIKVSSVYTDNFQAYSAGNLGGQGNWISGINNLTVIDFSGDKRVYSTSTSTIRLVYLDLVFPNDQYSQLTIDTTISVSAFIGPAVRCSSNNCYVLIVSADWIEVHKLIAGTDTTLDTANIAINAGDVIKLSISSNTLRCLRNGSPVSGLGDVNGDIASGGELTSGKPGILAYTADTGLTYIDDFECTAAS
jgi:hypothetical protein